MRILISNDDGIRARGIIELAKLARTISDDVWVVAPKEQCSAMSHKMTPFRPMRVTKVFDFPVEGVRAFSVGGTPGDSVKVALQWLMKDQEPDVLLTGINEGYNAGYDIMYSGTVAAAMEGAARGIPSYAFSLTPRKPFDLVEAYFKEVWDYVSKTELTRGQVWNINFPGCKPEECQGIKKTVPALMEFYSTGGFVEEKIDDEETFLMIERGGERDPEPGTDLYELIHNYISVDVLQCEIFH